MTLPTSPIRSVTTIHQKFYNASLPPITLEHIDLASLTTKSVSDLVATLGDGARLGVAASYGEKCVLEALAFSTESRVLLITMNGTSKPAKREKQILTNELLCDISLEKHGFFMERLAAALYLDLGLYIRHAFDITSDGDKRGSMAAYKGVLARARAQNSLDESIVEFIFAEQPFIVSRKSEFALRAWACYVAVQAFPDKPGAIDTSAKDFRARSTYQPCLEWMCKCVRDADRLDSLKPHYTVNDISTVINIKKGAVDIQCTRFKTRIRQSDSQVRFMFHVPRASCLIGEIRGHVSKVQGKAVKVTPQTQFAATAKIRSVVTIGKDQLTGAEASRADLILNAFKGGESLLSSPFVRKIFFPGHPLHALKWPKLPTTQPEIVFTYRDLNESQRKAVERCLSNKEEDRH
ncbi:hypothetical protein BDM02DRAFT_3144973, partial [Thelephora ganbajun]